MMRASPNSVCNQGNPTGPSSPEMNQQIIHSLETGLLDQLGVVEDEQKVVENAQARQ